MRIGNLKIGGKFFLAPMSGYTDIAFRHLCRKLGAACVFCEFVSAEGIVESGEYVKRALKSAKSEKPVGVQLFGGDDNLMGRACEKICGMLERGARRFDLVDLNFGCPAQKVVGAGAGGALLKKPEEIEKIVRECVKNSSLPVTAKIRAGWRGAEEAVKVAKVIEGAGADAITIHCRVVKKREENAADWRVIKKVKESVSIPVIGNGGVYCAEEGRRMLEETGCDAVMIARGALYNPFIFKHLQRGGKENENDALEEKRTALCEYVKLAKKFDVLSLQRVRLHAMQLCHGIVGAREMRPKIGKAGSAGEMEEIFEGGKDYKY